MNVGWLAAVAPMAQVSTAERALTVTLKSYTNVQAVSTLQNKIVVHRAANKILRDRTTRANFVKTSAFLDLKNAIPLGVIRSVNKGHKVAMFGV